MRGLFFVCISRTPWSRKVLAILESAHGITTLCLSGTAGYKYDLSQLGPSFGRYTLQPT